MKVPKFVANSEDDMHCLLACYRMLMQHFWHKDLTWAQMEAFSGFHDGKVPWTIRSLVHFYRMGLDIKVVAPFDYRRYQTEGEMYVKQLFSPEQYQWFGQNSTLEEAQPYLEEFLKNIDYECRQPTLQDVDDMLAEGRMVTVTLNSQALNGKTGFISHVILIYSKAGENYLAHDPGMPAAPERNIPPELLQTAMGDLAHITGFRFDPKRGVRLDQWVTQVYPELSRAHAAKLVAEGKVQVNNTAQTKPGHKLRRGDDIAIDFDPAELAAIPEISLDVIYEDDDCVVINKPAGVLTHSVGNYTSEGTVATWLRRRLTDMPGPRGGIVHRLDRVTSGVMICAKNPEALSYLQQQFAGRKVHKTYLAVIAGAIKPDAAIIDMPIERNPKAPATFRVGMQGKHAVTVYRTLETNERYSLLELTPETGRTHQLRVHLAQQGHPIVGDRLYGGDEAERLFLHAVELRLTLPGTHERKTFHAPVPPAFFEKVRS